jgi:hypothetical protein
VRIENTKGSRLEQEILLVTCKNPSLDQTPTDGSIVDACSLEEDIGRITKMVYKHDIEN